MEHLSPMLRKQLRTDGLCFSCREPLNPQDLKRDDNNCHDCWSEKEIDQLLTDAKTLRDEWLAFKGEINARLDAATPNKKTPKSPPKGVLNDE